MQISVLHALTHLRLCYVTGQRHRFPSGSDATALPKDQNQPKISDPQQMLLLISEFYLKNKKSKRHRSDEEEMKRSAYLARKGSSTTAEMSRRGLPIPRSTPS
jgi:hypothetical protein